MTPDTHVLFKLEGGLPDLKVLLVGFMPYDIEIMSPTSSVPRSPGSTLTNDKEVFIKTNGLHLELAPFRLEHVYDYEPGGHHPVHLGDTYGNNQQYRVIHKLGHGGSATVWLCRDTNTKEKTKYVALKILMAEISKDDCAELRTLQFEAFQTRHGAEDNGWKSICLPLDHFEIHGTNGDHICLVYFVLGPNVSLGLFNPSSNPDKDLRDISLQIVKAIQFMHSQGTCHGDLTPNNILHQITGLDGLPEDEVLHILGTPVTNALLNDSQEPHNQVTAPKYLVYPIKWEQVDTQFISKNARLIDFGESFKVSNPPEDLGTPGPYRSPELILEKKAAFGSDLWALGCTLFEIRTGRTLFDCYVDEDEDYLDTMVQILGKLPEPWWSETWKERRRLYQDEVDEFGRVVDAIPKEAIRECEGEERSGVTISVHPSVAQDARSLQDKIAPGVWYMSENGSGDRHRDIGKREQDVFADLLRKLLKYRPEDRISAKDATGHEWFSL